VITDTASADSPGVLYVKPRALGAEADRIAERLRQTHRVAVLENPGDIAATARDEWDVVAGPGSIPCDAAFFERLTRIRAVIAVGSGIDGIDRAAASERGVLIGDGTVCENARDMASATVLLMLALSHDLDGARQRLKAGRWHAHPEARWLGALTVGLIGFGRIGRMVARLLAPWKPRILVSAPRAPASLPAHARVVSLERLLRESDIVSIHTSLNASTRGLLGASQIATMKPSAMLINTARGGIVDESALCEALHAGRLRAAALDCFGQEPLQPDSPLLTTPNLILTPHSIGHTADGARAVAARFEENILRALRGDLPCNLRNPEVLDAREPTTS